MHRHSPDARPPSPGRWPDAAIAQLAGEQELNLSHAQLLALGVSASAIDRAVARGRLHRVHRAVYSLAPPRARPQLAGQHAAILAVGPTAVLSHVTAARLHGLSPPISDPRIHVTIVGSHRHHRTGIVVHRAGQLQRREYHRSQRLPVTSIARTVLDLTPQLSPPQAEALVGQALRKTSLTKLREQLGLHPRRPGAPLLRALLDPTRPSADAWSEPERRLLTLLRRAGLPLPELNLSIGPYRPDLVWFAQRVIVEYDSEEFHSGPVAARWDAARHNHLSSQGFLVLHVTWDELHGHPERVLVQIAGALAQRGGW